MVQLLVGRRYGHRGDGLFRLFGDRVAVNEARQPIEIQADRRHQRQKDRVHEVLEKPAHGDPSPARRVPQPRLTYPPTAARRRSIQVSRHPKAVCAVANVLVVNENAPRSAQKSPCPRTSLRGEREASSRRSSRPIRRWARRGYDRFQHSSTHSVPFPACRATRGRSAGTRPRAAILRAVAEWEQNGDSESHLQIARLAPQRPHPACSAGITTRRSYIVQESEAGQIKRRGWPPIL